MLRHVLLVLLLWPLLNTAATDTAEAIKAKQAIRDSLLAVSRVKDIGDIRPSPIPGIYEVEVHGIGVIYASSDGKYFMQGDLLKVEGKEIINYTEQIASQYNKKAIEKIPESEMIIFAPKDPRKIKTTITVFTDIDCGYCRKLHSEIENYNALGITVRYLAWPRGGKGSSTYSRMISVWCADNRQEALTQAKSGKTVASKECNHPIDRHYELGMELGVRGTPAIVLQDGTMLPGYVPPEALAQQMGL